MTSSKVWQWMKDNSNTIGVIIIPLGIGLWTVFTYFHDSDKETNFRDVDEQNNSAQIHNGDNVAGDKIINTETHKIGILSKD